MTVLVKWSEYYKTNASADRNYVSFIYRSIGRNRTGAIIPSCNISSKNTIYINSQRATSIRTSCNQKSTMGSFPTPVYGDKIAKGF